MVTAANEVIALGGGMVVVVDGEVRATLALPVGGLMSLEPASVVSRQVQEIEEALKAAGSIDESIEMTISLLALIVIEELHLSNRGLVELKSGQPPRFVEMLAA